MILRARMVLPVSQPPIENGAVVISGNRIREVGTWPDLSSSDKTVFDLGDVILLPGLINAHCHLDYTDMSGDAAAAKNVHRLDLAHHRRQNRVELFRIRPLLAARCPHAFEYRHDHRGRHRSHAGLAAGSLGRHAAARFIVSRNDRHPRQTRPEGNFARSC